MRLYRGKQYTELEWLHFLLLKQGNGLSVGYYSSEEEAINNGVQPGDYYYNETTKTLVQVGTYYDEETTFLDKTLGTGTIQRYSFAEDTDSKDYFNMPSMFKNSNNGELHAYFRGATNHSDFSDSSIYQAISTDGGATWASKDTLSDADIILQDDGNGGFDAPAVCQTPTGRILMFVRFFNSGNTYTENRTYYSDDNGTTWTQAAEGWAPNSIGYVYYDELVVGPQGEICITYRDIQASRYCRIAQSFDDGLTWSIRSTALDNTDKGWNFGEHMMKDLGNGTWIIISRFSDYNDDSEHYPFIMVSHDYGLTWAGENETLTFQDIQDGNYQSGFLKLEGVGVSLGEESATKSCLPYWDIVYQNGKRYALIAYHMRQTGDEGQMRITCFDIDAWLANGQDSIRPKAVTYIYQESPEGPGNIYDVEGNFSFVLDSNSSPTMMVGLTSFDDVTGGSSNGPQTIHYFSFDKVQSVIWLYENHEMYQGVYVDDTAAATGSCNVGQVYYNLTEQTLHTRMT